MIKHKDINVPLVGEDGNAFAILGRVKRIMRRAGIDDQWEEFHKEATASDYDHLLMTVMRWFSVDSTEPCVGCGTAVDADIHAEELGMCVDCSNEYYNHDDEEVVK